MTVLANGLTVPDVQVGHVDKVKGNEGTVGAGETGWPAVDVGMVEGADVELRAKKEVFDHFLEIGLLARLNIAYCDSIKMFFIIW